MPAGSSTMKINKEEIAFSEIDVNVKNPANNVEISVTKLDEKPAAVTHEIKGKVYQYVEVKKSNIKDENINNAVINFKVEKGWLTENNPDENYIVLNRYTTVWNELETSKISSEPKYAYYKALTPSFSYFSISVKENITSEISIENVSMASTVNFTEQTEVANESKKVKEEAVGKWRYSSLLVIAVVSFVIVPICYLIYKKAIKRFK